ncbi:MAG: amidohydrolase family protein [Actinomycetota bacterium]|nr:amidohydrolase family protein [Actinomycetota bacterium]
MAVVSSPNSSAPPRVIDAHVHVWNLADSPSRADYPWLGPQLPLLNRSYELTELAPELAAAGVDAVVLVQAADAAAETEQLLRVAADSPVPARVVGWLPLADPGVTTVALQRFRDNLTLTGVRHLIHDAPDPQWLLRADVAQGMELVAEAGLSFDAVAERPDLLAQLPTVAGRHPELTIVLDHLGKPPIADAGWQPWADLLAAAAAEPNVVGKISGLGTASEPGWTPDHWQRYVDHAIDVFGPDRLMLGGDWPVALQAGSYADIWAATLAVLDGLTESDRSRILGETAARVYRF